MTPSETVRYVTIPYIRTGVIAASILGWARALGETIAVLIISGNALGVYPHSIFDSFTTMAATIAALLDSALTDSTHMAPARPGRGGPGPAGVHPAHQLRPAACWPGASPTPACRSEGGCEPWLQPVVSAGVSRRRKLKDWAFWAAGGVAFVLIAAPAISIIVSVFHQALPALGWSLFTQRTNGVGLQNAILGSLLLLAGVADHRRHDRDLGRRVPGRVRHRPEREGPPLLLRGARRHALDRDRLHRLRHSGGRVPLGLLPARRHLIALSVLVTPYIVKTTEVALRQLPSALREGAAGLGMPRTSTLGRVLIPAALPAIMSGFIVALAISTGELAPLLFTAGFTDQNPSLKLFHQQVPYLTNVIYTDLSLPGNRAHATAAAAGMLSLVILIILIIIARVIAAFSRRKTARMTV